MDGNIPCCWSKKIQLLLHTYINCEPRFSSYECSRCLYQQLHRSRTFLLESSDHFNNNTMQTSTDHNRASRLSLLRCAVFLLQESTLCTSQRCTPHLFAHDLHRKEPKILVRTLWPIASLTATRATPRPQQPLKRSTPPRLLL